MELILRRYKAFADDYFYTKYPQQLQPQPVHVRLNPESRVLNVGIHHEIGNAVPMDVWHRRELWFRLPDVPLPEAVDQFLPFLVTYADTICRGYSKEYDGNNFVGRYTQEAEDAIVRMEQHVEAAVGLSTEDFLLVRDAREYFDYETDKEMILGDTVEDVVQSMEDCAKFEGIHVLDNVTEAAVQWVRDKEGEQ